jgi:hypothetical protein
MTRLPEIFYLCLIVLGLSGCSQPPDHQASPPGNIVPVEIMPYGQALFALDPLQVEKGLDTLADQYRFFLGDNPDTLAVLQIRDFIMDPLNRQLATDCQVKYRETRFLEEGLAGLFANCRENVPGFRQPAVYSYVSGLLYESPVQYNDSVLVIGLDMFLGRDYEPYRAVGLPVYATARMEKENILPECARQIAHSLFPPKTATVNLLDHMILEGKVLYAMDRYLPGTPDELKIGYTPDQLEWCRENEKSLWTMMIDQELLFSGDPLLIRKFIQDGPFTAGMPDGAPAMLGKWIGWQIVRHYMDKNDETNLQQLFGNPDSQQILSRSGYKPKK